MANTILVGRRGRACLALMTSLVALIAVAIAYFWWASTRPRYIRLEHGRPEFTRAIQELRPSDVQEIFITLAHGRYCGTATLRAGRDDREIRRLLSAVKTISYSRWPSAVPAVADMVVLRAKKNWYGPGGQHVEVRRLAITGYFDSSWAPVISPRKRSPAFSKVVEDILRQKGKRYAPTR